MVKRADKVTDNRESQLQFLRFLAFLNVFVLHISSWRTDGYPAWNGAVSAVTFFVMLSGILAGYSSYGKKVELSLGAIGKDIRKKFRKVYPLHVITTFCGLIYVGLPAQLMYDLSNCADELIQLARNLLLIQSWFPVGYMSYNDVSWYLSTLFFLYLLNIPLQALLCAVGKKQRHNGIFTAMMLVLLLATAGYSYLTYTSGYVTDVHFWQYVFPPARIGQYFIGMIAGYMLRERKERGLPRKTALFTIAEVLSLGLWVCALLTGESWYSRLVWWIFPNLLVLVVFLLGQGWVSKLFRFSPLVRLGDVSFECYLVHACVLDALAGMEPFTDWGRLVCIGISLGFTLLLAFYLHGKPRKTAGG